MNKLIILIIFVWLLFLTYSNDVLYNKFHVEIQPFKPYLNRLFDEVNIDKKIKQTDLADDQYVDLVLSGDDFKDMQEKMKLFLDNGFIADRENNWRKAKVVVNGKKQKIEYKFHGTHTASMIFGRTPLGIIEDNFSSEGPSPPPIGSGAFSLKIKHKKSSDYLNLMRKYSLISSYDNIELSTIAINKIAASLGLIAPYGKMVLLRVNGAILGSYMLVESNSKEWLERDHQLTNFTILKSNDDWNHKGGTHMSETDLYIADKEVKSSTKNDAYALGALELLLKAVRNNNIEVIKQLIDIDYMAKFMALLTIANNNAFLSGDNLRYIYNHSTGKFKFLFRIESSILENIQTVDRFNGSLFFSLEHKGVEDNTLKLFRLLLTDIDFLTRRDKELYRITQNSKLYKDIAQKVFNENMNVSYASKKPLRHINSAMNNFKKNFNINIEKAKKYLEYSKVYITKYTNFNGRKSLHILNDFNHPLMLNTIVRKLQDSRIIQEQVKIPIMPLQLDLKQKTKYLVQDVNVDTTDIHQLFFENIITGKEIQQKHIYINRATQVPYFSQYETIKMLNKNQINYTVNGKLLSIKRGDYNITSNIVIRDGFDLEIEQGTKLFLDEKVSFLIYGNVSIQGSKQFPIEVLRLNPGKAFGVFSILGKGVNNTTVNIKYLIVDGGSQAVVNGVSFTGQISIHSANVIIKNSLFVNSLSDDGINIKYSDVEITNSKFIDNFGDQIDLDFCNAKIIKNIFSYEKEAHLTNVSTDGLDVSGSIARVHHNSFQNFSDKAISVGEKSKVLIRNNNFQKNNSAISVKDASMAFIGKNIFVGNLVDISQYVKKKFYPSPNTYTIDGNKKLNYNIQEGDIFYLKPDVLINSFIKSLL